MSIKEKMYASIAWIYAIVFTVVFSFLFVETTVNAFDWENSTTGMMGIVSSISLLVFGTACEKYKDAREDRESKENKKCDKK